MQPEKPCPLRICVASFSSSHSNNCSTKKIMRLKLYGLKRIFFYRILKNFLIFFLSKFAFAITSGERHLKTLGWIGR